jgi:mercuric ion binding protein
MQRLFASLALAAVIAPVWAATQTVTLSVPGMTCAACPITVKKALAQVAGVRNTDVNLAKREVIVTYDDAQTNVPALNEATKNAGYPSTLVKDASR